MTSQEPDMQAMLERVEKLERQNRRMKRAALLALALIAALVLMGQAAPSRRTVEAEAFVLKDASGRVRGQLTTVDDDTAGLFLRDKTGRPALSLRVDQNGPALGFIDSA